MSKEEVKDIRTLAQLVKELNRKFCNGHDTFHIKRNKNSRTGQLMFDSEELVLFQPIGWLILEGMPSLNFYTQHFIMDFCYYSNPDYWFPSEEYNIIIAHNYLIHDGNNVYMAWHKTRKGFLTKLTNEDELNDEECRFSLADIAALKATQTERIQKIIELGKVKVDEV